MFEKTGDALRNKMQEKDMDMLKEEFKVRFGTIQDCKLEDV